MVLTALQCASPSHTWYLVVTLKGYANQVYCIKHHTEYCPQLNHRECLTSILGDSFLDNLVPCLIRRNPNYEFSILNLFKTFSMYKDWVNPNILLDLSLYMMPRCRKPHPYASWKIECTTMLLCFLISWHRSQWATNCQHKVEGT